MLDILFYLYIDIREFYYKYILNTYFIHESYKSQEMIYWRTKIRIPYKYISYPVYNV